MTVWLRIETGGAFTNASQWINLDTEPCPTLTHSGISSHWIE